MAVDDLQWPVMVLADLAADLDAAFVVERPPALHAAVARAAAHFSAAADPAQL
jgi:hypothetical protein